VIYALESRALARRIALAARAMPVQAAAAVPAAAAAVTYAVEDGVARIPVRGVLADRRSWLDELFGDGPELTYSEMADAILAAADDAGVESIMLDVDSPGGEVAGIDKAIEALQLARSVKPLRAQVGSMAASAAYWIASQAQEIRADSELSQVGSIGVAAAVYQPDGVYQIASSAAPRKRPDASTEAGQAVIRDELDAIHAVFARQVAEGRGVDVEKVNSEFGQGGIVLAADAAARGMIDAVKKLPGVAGAKPAGAKEEKGVISMTIDQIKAEAPDAAAALRDEGVQAERRRVAGLSAWKGINADADKAVEEAIASGKSYEEVAAQLAAAVAKGNSKTADGDNAPAVATGTAVNGANATATTVAGMSEADVAALRAAGMTDEEIRAYAPKGV